MEQKQRSPTLFSWADFDYIWQGLSRNQPKSTVKILSPYIYFSIRYSCHTHTHYFVIQTVSKAYEIVNYPCNRIPTDKQTGKYVFKRVTDIYVFSGCSIFTSTVHLHHPLPLPP
jgi:hypothetical protein